MSKGFFVPGNTSQNYVSNKKNTDGAYTYDTAFQEAGLQHQQALSSINKQYNATIESAYSNYLSANRGIRGSNMGAGYKEAYLAKQQEAQAAQIAELNYNAANVRGQLAENTNATLGNIQDVFNTEVAYMDRVASGANSYLGYLKTLTHVDDAERMYITEDKMNLSIDEMYDTVFGADIGTMKSFLDSSGNQALSYLDWSNNQFKDSEADRAYAKWFYSGGLQQFKKATKKGIKPY